MALDFRKKNREDKEEIDRLRAEIAVRDSIITDYRQNLAQEQYKVAALHAQLKLAKQPAK